MKFFESADGLIYPVDAIERMVLGDRTPNGALGFGRIYLKGGDFETPGVKVYNSTIEQVRRASGNCFAAAPGYVVLQYFEPDDGDEPKALIDELPVIGWRVSEYGDVEPLVYEAEWNGMQSNYGLLEPSGMVSDIHGSHYDSRAAWEAEQARCAAIDRQRRKAVAKEASARNLAAAESAQDA